MVKRRPTHSPLFSPPHEVGDDAQRGWIVKVGQEQSNVKNTRDEKQGLGRTEAAAVPPPSLLAGEPHCPAGSVYPRSSRKPADAFPLQAHAGEPARLGSGELFLGAAGEP